VPRLRLRLPEQWRQSVCAARRHALRLGPVRLPALRWDPVSSSPPNRARYSCIPLGEQLGDSIVVRSPMSRWLRPCRGDHRME